MGTGEALAVSPASILLHGAVECASALLTRALSLVIVALPLSIVNARSALLKFSVQMLMLGFGDRTNAATHRRASDKNTLLAVLRGVHCGDCLALSVLATFGCTVGSRVE